MWIATLIRVIAALLLATVCGLAAFLGVVSVVVLSVRDDWLHVPIGLIALALGALAARYALRRWQAGLATRAYDPLFNLGVVTVLWLVPVGVVLIWVSLCFGQGVRGLVPASIGGTLVALGWIVGSLFRQYESLAEQDRERRMVMRALRDEIFVVYEAFDPQDLEKDSATLSRRIRFGWPTGTPYHPRPTSPSQPVIFNALSSKVHLIERPTIERVTRFYAAYSELIVYTSDFVSDAFRNLPNDRRVAAFGMLHQRRKATYLTALFALEALNQDLGETTAVPTKGLNDALIEEGRNALKQKGKHGRSSAQ